MSPGNGPVALHTVGGGPAGACLNVLCGASATAAADGPAAPQSIELQINPLGQLAQNESRSPTLGTVTGTGFISAMNASALGARSPNVP